jgi:prevent-host-death family protein
LALINNETKPTKPATINESNDLSENLNMLAITANDAKTQFGDMLMKVQRAPVQINKNGKPVAVVVSIEEFEKIETMKLQVLQARAAKAQEEIQSNNTVDGEQFFDELENGQHD